jgi:hypothetical protein
MAGFALLQFTIAERGTAGPLLSRSPRNYYDFATDAALSGHLALKVLPRPELLKLADPYDPSLNAPYRLLDLSLYHGRYYIYWSLTPVVLLLGPWHLLTGSYLSEAAAAAIFGLACQAGLSWLLLVGRRAYFPKAGWGLVGLALAAAGVASYLPMLAAGDSVYGVPVASAAFCQALVWCALYRALHSARPIPWTWLAGAAFAFAIGSRPNYVLWSPCLLLPLWELFRRHPADRFRLALAAAGPPFLGVVAMAAINWIRFGQFSEFGLTYQLAASGRTYVRLSPANFASHWRVYGWSPPILSRYFPFLSSPRTGGFGMFSCLPAAYATLGLLLARRSRSLNALGWAIALAGIGGMLVMCAFPWSALRYMVDYLPATLVAAAWGAFAVADLATRRGWLLPRLVVGSAFASSLAVVLLTLAGNLGPWRVNCERLRPLARILNAPEFWRERLTGRVTGPLVIRFKLPRGRIGAFEPLVTVGSPAEGGEIVFLEYLDDRHARLGFFQTDTTHWLSPPLELDFAQAHELSVSLGSLLPPDSDPVFARWPETAIGSAQQDATLILDGRLVYKTALDFGVRHGERYNLGENRLESGVSQPRFTGAMLDARERPLSPAGPPPGAAPRARAGRWQVTVVFPANFPQGRHDPILTSGVPGAGDFIYAFYPQSGQVAFAHDSWGMGGTASPTIAIDPLRRHVIEIAYGGLDSSGESDSPAGSGSDPMADRLLILLDGVPVMDRPEHTYAASPETETPAENRIGGSTTASGFSGQVVSARWLAR